jgi:Restriction endonuclease
MLDFKELPTDGQDFELLVREILFREGFHVEWSGRGADGGRDLVCTETRQNIIGLNTKRWLVQCKHFAHAGRAVGIGDLDDIVTSAAHHNCSGYLLACSTFPSSAVVQRLEGISANQGVPLTANFWDAVLIERVLATPLMWRIAQRFFPVSASGFEIIATDRPNHWVVNYKGFYFHLSNRIGSRKQMHLESIEARVAEIQRIELPLEHHLRIRAVYYDDKNGGYVWYLDYLRPEGNRDPVDLHGIKLTLRDGWVLEDGQAYRFDIVLRSTSPWSDHYDPDHYDYYEHDSAMFKWGGERATSDIKLTTEATQNAEDKERETRERSFNALVAAFQKLPFLKLIRTENCNVESIRKFSRQWNWSKLLTDGTPRFFTVALLFWVSDEATFEKFMAALPQGLKSSFRLTKAFVYMPLEEGGSELSTEPGPYELTLSTWTGATSDMHSTRSALNDFMDRIAVAAAPFAAGSMTSKDS